MMKFKLLLFLTWLLTACPNQHSSVEPPNKPLGLLEISFTGIGANLNASASSKPQTRTMTDLGDGIQVKAFTRGLFDTGTRGVDGVRYLSATFKVRNANASGLAYNTDRQNLSLVAVSTLNTLGGSAVRNLEKFDGTPADAALALAIKPTHGMAGSALGLVLQPSLEDFQVFDKNDLLPLGRPPGVSDLLEYGFVVRCVDHCTPNSRALLANPAPEQFDGRVTVAVRLPLQASPKDDPFRFSMLFEVVDDSNTRITQSLEEQSDNSLMQTRAAALSNAQVVALQGSHLPVQKRCTVRLAGSSIAPKAFLVNGGAIAAGIPAFANQMNVPPASPIAAEFDRSMQAADANGFVVNGSLTGLKRGLFSGGNSSRLNFIPDPSVANLERLYPPGERLSVSLTRELKDKNGVSLCEPYSFQFRTRSSVPSDAKFVDPTKLEVMPRPVFVVTGDLNNDTFVDLITGSNETHELKTFLNDGLGAFNLAQTIPIVGTALNGVREAITGDFDRDGRLDLAVLLVFDSTVLTFHGLGNGQFDAMQKLELNETSGNRAVSLKSADLNSDGWLDLIVSRQDVLDTNDKDVVLILPNQGNGQFGLGQAIKIRLPRALDVADFNGDGALDVLIVADTNKVALALGHGDGTFETPKVIFLGSSVELFLALEVADLNNDGRLDLVLGTFPAQGFRGVIRVALQQDGGGFESSQFAFLAGTSFFGGLRLADMNGDGVLDLLATGSEATELLLGTGDGGFGNSQFFFQTGFGRQVEAADLNGDGKLEIVVAEDVITGNGLLTVLQQP
jgi:FG-GAP-like repeat